MRTQVFAIGEEVRETNDSGFLGTVATLHTQLLEDGSMLQVGWLLGWRWGGWRLACVGGGVLGAVSW